MKKAFFLSVSFWLLLWSELLVAQTTTPDTIRVLAIRVEFQKDSAATTTGDGKFDLGTPAGPFQIDPPPHNRSYFQDHLTFLKNYFWRASRGRVVILGEVFPREENAAYQLPGQMTDYNPNTLPDSINAALARLFRDAIRAADADTAVHFTRYDAFIIFHAGVGKDVDLGYDETPQDIPSFFLSQEFLQRHLGVTGIPVDEGATEVQHGLILPETESQDGLELGLNGIVVANFGSHLGFLDMFSPETRRSGIGRFGLMDAGLFNGDGLLPALPCAWTRIDAGWEEPIDVYYGLDDELEVRQVLSSHPNRVYRIPINEKEYFLVENRYAGKVTVDSMRYVLAQNRPDYPNMKEVLLTYFPDQVTFSERGVLIDVQNPDMGLPGSGCLIWHVDENVIDRNRQANRINADPEHRGVDLEEADGSQDIGQAYDFFHPASGSETGWVLDMWYSGNTAPIFQNEFSPATIPSSRSYYNRANSHITLSHFSAPDSVMTFRVKLNIFQQGFPQMIDVHQVGRVNSLKTAHLDAGEAGDLILTTSGNYLLIRLNSGITTRNVQQKMIQISPDHPILPPPVVFDLPGGNSKGLMILTTTGRVYGFRFFSDGSYDTLFQPIQLNDTITTYPVVNQDEPQHVRIVWGAQDGTVFQANVLPDTIFVDQLYHLGETIRYVHWESSQVLWAITSTGRVFRDGQEVTTSPDMYTSPVGFSPVSASSHGGMRYLELGPAPPPATENLFVYLSPLVSFYVGEKTKYNFYYAVTGINRLYVLRYNFVLQDNFPVTMYRPERDVPLTMTPLVGTFPDQSGNQSVGIVITDLAGLLDGYSLDGKRLPDFPLIAGDELGTHPVLTDLDGDGDVELVVVTRTGLIYAWDLSGPADQVSWGQLYADEHNSNLPGVLSSTASGTSLTDSGSLLPAEKVYNWPNPAREGYTFIRYYLTAASTVHIRIFDVAGDLVTELEGTGYAMTPNEVKWDLTDVQSGVYLARVEAQSVDGSKKEVRLVKIAVIK